MFKRTHSLVRVTYAKRADLSWGGENASGIHQYSSDELHLEHLGFDLSFLREEGQIQFGGGISINNSFYEHVEAIRSGFDGELLGNYPISRGIKTTFGVNGRICYEVLPRLYVNLTYTHILSPQEEFNEPNGRSRLDLTVSYDLITGD